MATGVTTKDSLFIPEVLADAVEAGFVGLNALLGTGAAIVNTQMPYGRDNVGESVKIPYFDLIGEFEDISPDGGEASPAELTSAAETSTVKHAAKGVEFTRWAQYNPTDPYAEGSRQINVAAGRKLDSQLLTVAMDTTGWTAYTNDVFNATTPKLMTYDVIVNGVSKLGDEGHSSRPALMVVHSKVIGDMRLDKDADGNPRLVKTPMGIELPVVDTLGIPIMTSDKLVSTLSSGVAKYQSLIIWPGALVAWVNGTPLVLEETNARKPSDATYVHFWYTTHRYKHLRQRSKPGVVHLFTN